MPLHLRPCPGCETINPRAASHCRKCGEAFTFHFALAAADAGDSEVAPASLEAPPAPPAPRAASSSRASALLVGVVAAAGLSAFYAYRDPAPMAEGARPAEAATAAVNLPSGPPPAIATAEERVTPLAVTAPSPPAAIAADARSEAANTPVRGRVRANGALSRPRAMAASQARAHAKPTTVRKIAPKRSRAEVQTAGRQPVIANAPLSPCTEGSTLATSCDVRMIAKGN
jgi:hypothetical protein